MNINWWHRAYGRHSNIPECCIDFWLGWYLYNSELSLGERYFQMLQHIRFWEREGKSIEYIPCPECVRHRRFNQIHDCTKQCFDWIGWRDACQYEYKTRKVVA